MIDYNRNIYIKVIIEYENVIYINIIIPIYLFILVTITKLAVFLYYLRTFFTKLIKDFV